MKIKIKKTVAQLAISNSIMKVCLLITLYVTSAWSYTRSIENETPVCVPTECKIEDECRCSSKINPIDNTHDPAPQFIAITLSSYVYNKIYDSYFSKLFFNKKNPDGNPSGFTFYISHEYTNYTLVRDLYLRGYEIGVNSITRSASPVNYWEVASLQDLEEEFGGQKIILSTFANVPAEDITGARTPQLRIQGDVSIQAYINSNISYDNSWAARVYNRLLPYTLDYASTQECFTSIKGCPVKSHPKFWIAPISDLIYNNTECATIATCDVQGTADEIALWLMEQLNSLRNKNRAPLILKLDTYWFEFTDNSLEGFSKFLDDAQGLDDVFFVSVQDVLAWMHNPVPVSQYTTPVHNDRNAECSPVNCSYTIDGSIKIMGSCVPCPKNFPWKGNPLGQ